MDQSSIYGQQNFNLPHDVVKLPSGGIFYATKKKSLKVGYLNASDENILMAGSEIREGLITTLLRGKIYETDIKPEDLLQGDIQAILIFLRNTAFGPDYDITLVDPETGKDFQTTISLESLFIKKTQVEPNEFGFYETTLPNSGYSVKLKPLSYGEIMEIDAMSEKYPKGRVAPKQTWKLNKIVQEINGSSDKMTISQTIDLLPIVDAKYIRKFIDENEPSLDLKKEVIAPSGRKLLVDIAFGVDFFRPFF